MARTLVRGKQIRPADVIQENIKNGYIDLETEQSVSAPKSIEAAFKQALPKALGSTNGIIALDNTSNIFLVSGSEEATSFTGWASGIFVVIWDTTRTVKHTAGSLELIGGFSRIVNHGDVSQFMYVGSNSVKEISFEKCETVATRQTLEKVLVSPSNQISLDQQTQESDIAAVYINGIVQSKSYYSVVGELYLQFQDTLYAGDEVRVVFSELVKVVSGGTGGTINLDSIDGGTF